MVGKLNYQNPGFWFLRHGETPAQVTQTACGGDCQMSLNQSGRMQVRAAAALMRESQYVPHLIITSDLDRTVESAQIIQSELNPDAEILIDPDIKERSLGDWNGQSSRVINPQLVAGLTPVNGESRSEFHDRVMRCFNRHLHHLSQWPLFIGSRGNARILLEFVNDFDPANFLNGRMLRVEVKQSSEFEVRNIERF